MAAFDDERHMMHNEASDDDEDVDQQQDGQGGGNYATLQTDGPQASAGSAGHPDTCMPCTFYCFTRRGCNRGDDCKFCHFTHQSKLQQRRESWKKQQREKRKLIRERMASDAVTRKLVTDARDPVPLPQAPPAQEALRPPPQARVEQQIALPPHPSPQPPMPVRRCATPDHSGLGFCYNPNSAIVTIGQDIQFDTVGAPTNGAVSFSLMDPLPPGMQLHPTMGTIYGAPTAPFSKSVIRVQADCRDGRVVQAGLEVEVVDLTRGGYVVGHISELEPGKFMMLLYAPEDNEGNGSDAKAPAGGASNRLPDVRSGGVGAPQRNYFSPSNGQAATATARRPPMQQRGARRAMDANYCAKPKAGPSRNAKLYGHGMGSDFIPC